MWKRGLRRSRHSKTEQDDVSLSSADTEGSEPSAVSDNGMPTGSTDVAMTPTEAEPQPLDLMHKTKDESDSKRSITPQPEELRKSPKELVTRGPTDLSPKHLSSKISPSGIDKTSELKDLSSRSVFDPGHRMNTSNGFSFGLTGASSQSSENARDTPEDLSVSKDDDDDDDGDDDSDKMNDASPPGVDPERLKAFNMFCRLFVDENLDRMVPISKQPKEKIQAIIEACYRQFPEFHERARKRIRTYLKSCRRMKRHRDQNGLDSTLRPTPPHLTSARAEHILAAACESESENAKRLRMELMQAGHNNEVRMETQPTPPQPQTPQATPPTRVYEDTPKHSPRPVDYRFANGVTSHESYYGSIAPHHGSILQPSQHAQITNGPTDLSVKKLPSSKTQLSPTEVANIRQLITSYRESAAFLYRSADELEQMLLQLN